MAKWDVKIERNEKSRLNTVDFNQLAFGKDFTDHMFIADYSNGQWGNCHIVPFGPIEMHPATFVLHYAQSIFEGMKSELGPNNDILLFRPTENAKRFSQSAKRMAMPPVPEDLFIQSIEELIKLDYKWIPKGIKNASLYIRPFLFATDPILGVKVGDSYRYMVILGPAGSYYSEAVNVWIQDKYVRAFPGGTGAAKFAGNYAATLQPVMEAKKRNCQQILWTDGLTHTYFQEIGTMNIFFVINDILITPSLEEGTILHGITRNSLIDIAKKMGIKVEERKVTVEEFLVAYQNQSLQDMFGAGTAAVVQAISGFVHKEEFHSLDFMPRKISKELKSSLESIKEGKANDEFGWIHTIQINEKQN